MLPIVGRDVEGTRVSIYNQGTHAKFPLLGLKFKNTSGMNLMQGPITVLDNNTYAGDSRILDLQPNEERLLSYAIDLGTEVEPTNTDNSGRITKVKLHKGLLYSTSLVHEGKTYKAKNRGTQDRLLIVEHPFRPEFHLVSKESLPSKRGMSTASRSSCRRARAPSWIVAEERDVVQTVQLTNSDDQTMRFFFSQSVTSDKVKAALQKAIDLRGGWAKTQQELGKAVQQLKDVTDDQVRLRANIKELPSTSPVYKKYLEKFEKQEGQIEEMQASIKSLQDQEHKQRQDYENFLAALDGRVNEGNLSLSSSGGPRSFTPRGLKGRDKGLRARCPAPFKGEEHRKPASPGFPQPIQSPRHYAARRPTAGTGDKTRSTVGKKLIGEPLLAELLGLPAGGGRVEIPGMAFEMR